MENASEKDALIYTAAEQPIARPAAGGPSVKDNMRNSFLFTDLDETLLRSDKTIGEEDLSAINAFLDNGNFFAFVTGRPFVDSLPFAKKYALEREGVFIAAFNGGEIREYRDGTWILLRSLPVSYEDAELLFTEAEGFNIHCQTYCGKYVLALHETEVLKGYTGGRVLTPKVMGDLKELLNYLPSPPPKVVCAAINDRPALQRFKEYVDPKIKGRLFSLFSSDKLLEFGDVNATKAKAVEFLAKKTGVLIENTIAVGDEENDISMIEAAGTGYAVKNAREEVKASADRVTEADNNHGAIAEILRRALEDK